MLKYLQKYVVALYIILGIYKSVILLLRTNQNMLWATILGKTVARWATKKIVKQNEKLNFMTLGQSGAIKKYWHWQRDWQMI